MGDDRLRAPELLGVLVESHLARDDLAEATTAAAEMVARAEGVDHSGLRARVAAAQAMVFDAAGDVDAALSALQSAVDGLSATAAPVLHVELLLALAALHERRGAAAEAAVEARAAASILRPLDIVVDADKVALLRRLAIDAGRGPATPSPELAAGATATLRLIDRRAEVLYDNVRAPLPLTKGLRYLADLLANPGVERHALDLVDRVEGLGEVDRRSLGHAGASLDGAARTAYRARIEELRSEVGDALAAGNDDVAMQKQEELDRFVSELAAAFGLGGRERHVGSVPEKARLNVTRALRAAIGKIAEVVPVAAGALDRDVRTGLYCAYEPAGEPRWIVQS